MDSNVVAEKRFDFAHNSAGQFTALDRYADLAGSEFVANTAYSYDGLGRLTSLQHSQGVTSLAGYAYTYDATGQLTDADHTGQADEAYSYDENGNRVTSTVGANNQILSDGTFDYEYDDEGNMVAKEAIATGERVEYAWDHRNRLISIVNKDALGAVTQQVDQAYDVFQRWVHRSVDSDGAGPSAATDTFFTYEGNQIALEFDGNTASDLTHRYLWGDMVDQILADEHVSSLASAGEVIYPLTDHLNTTRDLATYDAGTNLTTNANHRRFDSFGNLISQTNGSITILVGFTARPFDVATGLQWNLNRWYVSTLSIWMSEDPVGFEGGDSNLRRYVGNNVMSAIDPLGLTTIEVSPTSTDAQSYTDPQGIRTTSDDAGEIAGDAAGNSWNVQAIGEWESNATHLFNNSAVLISRFRIRVQFIPSNKPKLVKLAHAWDDCGDKEVTSQIGVTRGGKVWSMAIYNRNRKAGHDPLTEFFAGTYNVLESDSTIFGGNSFNNGQEGPYAPGVNSADYTSGLPGHAYLDLRITHHHSDPVPATTTAIVAANVDGAWSSYLVLVYKFTSGRKGLTMSVSVRNPTTSASPNATFLSALKMFNACKPK